MISQAAAVLGVSKLVLLDFDGPVCSVFAGYPAPPIADDVRRLVLRQTGGVPKALRTTTDPHAMLRAAPAEVPQLVEAIEDALREAELTAVASAVPTPGVADLLVACRASRRPVVIVSNNCEAAVRAYLGRIGLSELVDHIQGRDPGDPRLMKPHPHLLEQAADRGRRRPARLRHGRRSAE